MTINELAHEYETQFQILNNEIDALKPLLCVCKGKDLEMLRKRIKIYYDMACECKRTATLFKEYESEE